MLLPHNTLIDSNWKEFLQQNVPIIIEKISATERMNSYWKSFYDRMRQFFF